ncbi:phosphotransferase enzyme family protein [Flindersiella endophytica]
MAELSPGTTPDPDCIAALEAWQSILGEARIEPIRLTELPLWRVVAEDGRAYALKKLPEFPPGAGPVDAYRVITHLRAKGIPVAAPIVTDGAAIHTVVAERRYSLVPFVPSDPGNHETGPHAKQTSYAIGKAIAEFDSALADCPWPVSSFVDDPAPDILDGALPKLPEVAEMVAPLTDRLRETVTGLPMQRIHGDCNTGNVLVHRGNVSGFIDIDHLSLGPRVRDLSDYLASRLRDQLDAPGTAPILAVLSDYVAGYHATAELTDQELAAVVPIILLLEIGLVRWFLYGWVPNPAKQHLSMRAIAWITEHFDELVSAAAP